jgi:ATP-dependent Zn protease
MTLNDLLAEVGDPDERPRSLAHQRRVAVHEAGHVVAYTMLGIGTVLSATILAEGATAGRVQVELVGMEGPLPGEMQARLVCILAGRAAEEAILGEAGGGCGGAAGSDLAEATHLALLAELSLGLGEGLAWHGALTRQEIGPMLLGRPGLSSRVEGRLNSAYADALILMREHNATIEAVAQALLARETLGGQDLVTIIAGQSRKETHSSLPSLPARAM